MSFYKDIISSLSGLDRINTQDFNASVKADSLYQLHPTDHRNKGQVAVREQHVADLDDCSSDELHQKTQEALERLSNLENL